MFDQRFRMAATTDRCVMSRSLSPTVSVTRSVAVSTGSLPDHQTVKARVRDHLSRSTNRHGARSGGSNNLTRAIRFAEFEFAR